LKGDEFLADIFLMIDSIQGESQDPDHKKEIEIISFSWSESNPAPVGVSPTPGKVVLNDLHLQMAVSKASLKLFLTCAKGEHIKTACLTVRKPGKGGEGRLGRCT
jgi:type VI secretion system secreted protein Hcp